MLDSDSTEAKFAKLNEQVLRNLVKWRDFAEIEAWAEANGGEPAVRRLLASRKQLTSSDKDSVAVGNAWIASIDSQRADRSTGAAERSATWAGWAIVISIAALLVATLAYLKG